MLFSNTARAHELDKTRDGVLIYWENKVDGQCTVVTAGRGELAGQRVVRGRGSECRAYYGASSVGGVRRGTRASECRGERTCSSS